MKYDFKNGYCTIHTPETIERINDRARGAGRIAIRYNVILRDGKMTVIHHNITAKELEKVRAEIIAQGNKLW